MSVIFSSGGKELRDTKITGLILTGWADTERRLSLAMWSTVEGIGIFGCRFLVVEIQCGSLIVKQHL
jgi:hypothetical protein